ncbi:hypothetical protein TanjilG_31752 [Lupinus angustifolius]|uniref:F-box domain-containing protein n=1 Tax=Lupinus angustifolius TaxID=3871 RepID=A0A4P1RML3_LUPAN|nr:PREDICTED: F-box protein At1g61340-like [Lupinus angustifolius]OIW13863.1 hypothetical protein TanjilG_31752 [Lupinus angustifolius]
MALGFDNCYARALGRKRVVVSNNVEASNPMNSSLKRVCSGTFSSISERSSLEALPFDILIKVLCGVEHEDLEQLFHVSKIIKEAAEIAKRLHFEYSTPKKKTFAAFHIPIDVDSSNEFEEIKAPNAPLRKYRSRLNGRIMNMESICSNLFPSMDEDQ